MSIQLAKREFFHVMERQFNSTFRLAENSLDIIGQMARTWAFHFAGDAGLPGRLQGPNHALISQEVEHMRESAHCDTIVVLDHQGRIVHHSAFDEKNGESLMAWQIVRQAVNEGKSSYAIIEEQGNFIVYGSGITPVRAANKSGAHPYIVLAGFKISDELVAKLSQDTAIGLTFVRRSAVMASSLSTAQRKLIDIPISYLDYQTLYNDPLLTREVQIGGQAFYASVRQLHILDPVMDGSLLLTYPRKELYDIVERLQREYLWLYAVGMLLFALLIWRISYRIMEPLRKLAGRVGQIANGDMTPTVIEKRDEIGSIASSINDLLGELATSKQRIERHAGELELLVEQRTGELRESEAKLHAILDNAPVGIWLVGVDKRYHFVNQTFCDAVGIPESRFLETAHLPDLMGEEMAANCIKSDQECFSKETPHISYEELTFVDGKRHLMEITKVKLRDSAGAVTGSIGIAIDITERKEFEEELKRSNTELEQFSYAVSHDMRQPLRMISSYLQLLERSLTNQLDGEKRDYFNFAIEGAKRIDQMLVALLEYSRVGKKGEPMAWIESRAVLDEALQFLQPAIAEARARVNVAGDWPRILGSHDEILRLLQNLIGNAAKYRIAGRTPEISVTGELVGNEWHLCVADNGVGIIPDQIKRLFQVFQRLQSREAYEGSGVGLALCRKIAEHHKGRIWAESEGEGRGSRFCVVLPVLRGVDDVAVNEKVLR